MFVENCRSHAKDSREERIDNMVRIVHCTKDLPAGSILNEDCLKLTVIEKMNRPADAVYDTWIVIGRSTRTFLKKGNPIRFQDVFPQELLTDAIVRYIENQQGQTLMYPARVDRDPRTLVPMPKPHLPTAGAGEIALLLPEPDEPFAID